MRFSKQYLLFVVYTTPPHLGGVCCVVAAARHRQHDLHELPGHGGDLHPFRVHVVRDGVDVAVGKAMG